MYAILRLIVTESGLIVTIPFQTYTMGIKCDTEKKREKVYTQKWV